MAGPLIVNVITSVRLKEDMMRRLSGVSIAAVVCALAGTGLLAVAEFPSWAYGVTMPPPPAGAAAATPAPAPAAAGARAGGAAAPDTTMHSLPGATQQFTRAQIANQYGPADWYPGDHPQMPEIVAKGKQAQNVAACSLCHMPNGKGRPENAPVAGFPVEYFVKTMMDFRTMRGRVPTRGRPIPIG